MISNIRSLKITTTFIDQNLFWYFFSQNHFNTIDIQKFSQNASFANVIYLNANNNLNTLSFSSFTLPSFTWRSFCFTSAGRYINIITIWGYILVPWFVAVGFGKVIKVLLKLFVWHIQMFPTSFRPRWDRRRPVLVWWFRILFAIRLFSATTFLWSFNWSSSFSIQTILISSAFW